jgi:nucleotide-binding universal stress UspA family protein
MSKRILAATDLSEGSNEALRQAHACALSEGGKLAVCYVLPALFGLNALFPPRDATTLAQAAELEARVRHLIGQRIAACMPEASVEIFVDQGSAYAEIVRRAETWSADLVVVGSHGMSGMPRGHLGSVAEHVVRNAHCPVLVARANPARSGVVVVATDLSGPSMPAVAAGVEEARRRGARLVVVHAIDFASLAVTIEEIVLDVTGASANWNIDEEIRKGVETKIHDALEKCSGKGEARVVSGTAAAAIVRCADAVGAELVVVGTRGRTGLTRLALGSVAERVIRSAACSVLAVRLTA